MIADTLQSKVDDFKLNLGELGIRKVNYCLEGGVSLLYGRSGAQGSMKGRRNEVRCYDTAKGEEVRPFGIFC